MMAVVGCTPPDPLLEGEGLPHEVCLELAEIDSLMWRQPDSAFAMLQEFASSAAADSLDEFNWHYCQMLISELLYKNDYKQSNREELLEAVSYFDSIVGMDGADARGKADTRGVSVQERDAFLDARAHYINGVGLYERDSVVEACGEYLKALEIVETHFPHCEEVANRYILPNHLPLFMVLTYSHLVDLFSSQFIRDPAIICCKKALAFNNIESGSSYAVSNLLNFLGQYYVVSQPDSAEYYYNEALLLLPDSNNLVYRDLISSKAVLAYNMGKGYESSIHNVKRMAAQADDENEKMTRFLIIGGIYYNEGQYDSALIYLTPVFENKKDIRIQKIAARFLHDIHQSQGDTLKSIRYAMFQAENAISEGENNAQVSQLNDMIQSYLQWEQKRADAERLEEARVRRNRMIVATGILAVLAALTAWLLHRRKMKAEREAHRLERASMSGRLKKSNQEVRELKDQIKRQEEVNAKPQQAESFTDEPICRLIMERVHEGQFKAQMDCKLFKDAALSKEQVMALRDAADRHFNLFTIRLAKAYPNLTKNDLDYCCLYLLGLSDADISALMQRAYTTVNDRGRKMKAIFGTEEPLSATLRGFAEESTSN